MYFNNGHPDHESTTSIIVHSSCFLTTRVRLRLDPLRLHTCLGLARTPAILYDPGCRLHILRCEPRSAMHVSAVVIRCKSSLSRTASPTHQDACRFYSTTAGILGPGTAPVPIKYFQVLQVNFMAHPSQSKIEPRASPWLVSPLPTPAGGSVLVDGAWRLLLYVCTCCRDGCVHCMCARLGLPFVTMAKYSTVNAFVPTSCPTAFDRTALQAKSQVSAARSVSLRHIVCLNNGSALDCQGQGSSIGGLRAATTTLKILLVVRRSTPRS